MKATRIGGDRKAPSNSGFLLLEPRSMCDSGEVAKRIARCRGVKEVHLTSGKYGFVVFAKADSGNTFDSITSSVRKLAKTKSVNLAVSQLVYR
jgi:hypothetical protein